MNKNQVTSPSDKLAIAEEYIPGTGTYLDNQGNIRASIFGECYINLKRYTISVFSKSKKLQVPKKGDIVIGIVQNIRKYNLTLKVYYLNKVETSTPYNAFMHIAQIANYRINEMHNAFEAGDIIRGKVIDAHTVPFQISTCGLEFGVIKSWCIKCGGNVIKYKKNNVKCKTCAITIEKKVSIDFGKI